MNYADNYYQYIAYVKTLVRKKHSPTHKDFIYYEAHHIFPKSIYPDKQDDPNNIVLLTAREHYLAHYLLTKIYTSGVNHQRMVYAFASFQRGRSSKVLNAGGQFYTNSRLWAASREAFARYVGRSKSGNNASHKRKGVTHWNTGSHRSEKSRALMSERAKQRPPRSQETRELMRQKMLGMKMPPKSEKTIELHRQQLLYRTKYPKIYCKELDRIYGNARIVAEELHLGKYAPGNIRVALRRGTKAYGYSFCYINTPVYSGKDFIASRMNTLNSHTKYLSYVQER